MGRRPCCSKESVNRGAWSAEEDQILTNYIKTHGEGKWRGVPQEAGLNRCGKSCRLRWLNYLRPDIKRGAISVDEEDLILRLHRLLGNRWALIAKRLPGRTDNEIKNYWNTNLVKKLQDKTSSYPSLRSFKSKQEKTFENHVMIRPMAFHCRKVLISPEEGNAFMNTSSTEFVCDDQNNLSTLMQVEDDSSLNFLMDFDISQLIVPDILNSNFLQIEGNNEVPAEVGSVAGVTSTSDFLLSENEVLKENGMICDPLQTSLDMELMKVSSFFDLED